MGRNTGMEELLNAPDGKPAGYSTGNVGFKPFSYHCADIVDFSRIYRPQKKPQPKKSFEPVMHCEAPYEMATPFDYKSAVVDATPEDASDYFNVDSPYFGKHRK